MSGATMEKAFKHVADCERSGIMAEGFSAEWARGVISGGVDKAKGFVEDPEKMEGLLDSLKEKLKGLPDTVGTAFQNVPLMASMVKSYVTREYTDVSPKVIISLVSSFIYLVKQKDIIADTVPLLGLLDDLAVATVAMAICEPELKAYAEWCEHKDAASDGDDAPFGAKAAAPADAAEQAEAADQMDAVERVDVAEQVDTAEQVVIEQEDAIE